MRVSQPDLSAAQHEAAHVVVGVSLGLVLGRASAVAWCDGPDACAGYAWFPLPPGRRTWAQAIMVAAGVAWERALAPSAPDSEGPACYDWAELVATLPSRHDAETCVKAAGALLAGLGAVHGRVTRALLARDVTGHDVAALARGERLALDD